MVRRGVSLGVVLLCAFAFGFAATAQAGTLVSLGDSFSSGEGAGKYDQGTDGGGGCHRSFLAWPRLLGVSLDDHLACSGAVIDNFYDGHKANRPDNGIGQIGRLKTIAQKTPVERVLLTMSGNDIGFGSIVTHCALVDRSCLNNLGALKQHLQDLQPRLVQSYKDIAAAADAPVLVVGYPDILPTRNASDVPSGCRFSLRSRGRAEELIGALDDTLRTAAASASASSSHPVEFVSIAGALRDHELCMKDKSWVYPIGVHGGQQRAHPAPMGQLAMANAVRTWLEAHPVAGAAQCTPSDNVAAIIDDSGSMSSNDPQGIRRRAMELLLSKPAAQSRTFGAVEFAGSSAALFAPAVVSAARPQMLSSLDALQNDGIGEADAGGTDYNAGFRASADAQPKATSRIFLTDGGHNDGDYENLHRGGPPTYVIGLNIGRAGEGSDDADRLQQIASDTGGVYYPLKLQDGDSPEAQVSRLQGVVNEIDAHLTCAQADTTTPATLSRPNRPSPAIGDLVAKGQNAAEIVISWGTDQATVNLASAYVRNLRGQIIGDLRGTKRIRPRFRKRRAKLAPSVVQGRTFQIITLPLPAGARSMTVTVSAPVLPAPTDVTVQIRPAAGAQPPGTTQVGGNNGPGSAGKGTITVQTAGSGSVVSAPAGIACPGSCTSAFTPGTVVTLTPAPAPGGWTFAGWSGACNGTGACAVTADAAAAKTAKATFNPPPPHPVDAYSNYGPATAGRAMCRGNPGNAQSMPGGGLTQSFTVPAGVASLSSAKVQIDPDAAVTAHLTLYVNGAARASANAAAAGDTVFGWGAVPVSQGDSVALAISFTASAGKIITVYSAANVGGTLSISNSCPAGAPSLNTGDGLRAVVSGMSP